MIKREVRFGTLPLLVVVSIKSRDTKVALLSLAPSQTTISVGYSIKCVRQQSAAKETYFVIYAQIKMVVFRSTFFWVQ